MPKSISMQASLINACLYESEKSSMLMIIHYFISMHMKIVIINNL
jgi:hypothetical protein